MPHQEALMVMAKIQPEKMDDLKELLGTIAENVEENSIFPLKINNRKWTVKVTYQELTEVKTPPAPSMQVW